MIIDNLSFDNFHLDGIYGYWMPRGPTFEKLARKMGFLPLFMWGRWNIPLFIPKPKKLHMVFGKPIEIPVEGDDGFSSDAPRIVSVAPVVHSRCRYYLALHPPTVL